MRIVFFQIDLGRGGAESVAVSLSNYLRKKGNTVHVLTINKKGLYAVVKEARAKGLKI